MEEKKYKATVKINGKEPEEFIMTGKSSIAVKKLLTSFFKRTLGEDIEIKIDTVRVERIDGDYIEIK